MNVKGAISSQVKLEILDENGNLEMEFPWRSNLITDRFLEAFANKTFANVDDLRNYLVIGASPNPKPEIKRASGNITATTSVQGQEVIFTTSTEFFYLGTNWANGWEIVIPSTGAYARIVERLSDTQVKIDRNLNLTSPTAFEVWNVGADLPVTDRIAVSDQQYGQNPDTAVWYDQSLGAYLWRREIGRIYTVSGQNPISFSSFAFSPTGQYGNNDFTNATIYELVRNQNGAPTTVTINPGKRIRVRHRLTAIVFLSNNTPVQVKEYDLVDQEINSFQIPANNVISATNNTATNIRELFEKLLSPASNLQDGAQNVAIELAPLDSSGNEISSLKKTFTSANLLSYTSESFSRAKEFFLSENDFVGTFYGIKLTYKRAGNTMFTMTTQFGSNSSFQKDDLHELRVRVNVSWYRYYTA